MEIKAEILSTGDEVRSGAIVDSNSAYIAQKLEEAGVEVTRQNCVGDDIDILVEIFREISGRSDIAVVTGGLGPTEDDLTAEAAAKAAGVELVLDNAALESIEALFKTRNRPLTTSNKKQAIMPVGSTCLLNPVGTAPGFILKINRCIFFFLPGVPYEMERMLSDSVLPEIEKLQGKAKRYHLVKNISTFGLTEAATGEKLAELTKAFPEIKLGLRAIFPEIHVKLYIQGEDKDTLNRDLERATEWVSSKLGVNVLSIEGDSMEAVVGSLLADKKKTVALAESCTGGLVAHKLTGVPGSSDYFLFSGVTYSNQSKIDVFGVSPATLEQHGAVHEETVKEMAEGAKRIAGATFGLSTSGIAGPTGGTEEKPVGTVCIGLAGPDGVEGFRYTLSFGRRSMNKEIFAVVALDLLRRKLLGVEERYV